MPITGENRTRLNGFIHQLKQQNRDDEIPELVRQFKSKFEEEEEERKPITGSSGDIPERSSLMEVEEKARIPKPAAAGFIESATLGLPRLIPKARERMEELKTESPGQYMAGEMAGYVMPGFGPATAFKGAGKIAGKIIPKAPKFIKGMPGIKTMAQAGMAGAVTEGVRGATEEGGIDVKEGLKRAAVAAPVAAVTAGAIEGAGAGLRKAGGAILKKVLPGKKFIPKGYKPEHIKELKVEGTVKETLKKATKKSKEVGQKIDDILSKNVDPSIRFNPEKSFINVKKKIYDIKEARGFEKEIVRATEKIYIDSIKPRGLSGKDLDAKQMRELRNIIGDIAFPKSVELKTADPVKIKAAKIIYFDMMDDVATKIPEIVKPNQDYHKLKNIMGVADQAIEASATRKGVPASDIFRTLLLLSGGGAYMGGHKELGAAIGLGALGSKALMTGKGAQIIGAAGKGIGKEGIKRTAAALAGSQAGRLRLGKEEEEELSKFKFGRR